MKCLIKILASAIVLFSALQSYGETPNPLEQCRKKQVEFLTDQSLTFSFQEVSNELEHSFEPWQQTRYEVRGQIWLSADDFMKSDTLTDAKSHEDYFSKTQFSKTDLLFVDYGDTDLFAVTQSMFLEQPLKTARYSPVSLINYFYEQKISANNESNNDYSVYQSTINKTIVKLYIRKRDNLVSKIAVLSDDELFGDVLTAFLYADYSNAGEVFYPTSIHIEKINGKITDEVKISKASLIRKVPQLLDKPGDYKLKRDVEIKPEIKVEKYSRNIHFIELKHTDDRVMIVEFSDFMLVAEAPLNSENGELIISEAEKIAPGKPISYFVFGHYHPHYIGGIRPFIHTGAKILCSQGDEEYASYLANAPHTLNPDSLQLQPRKLQIEEIEEHKTITDGKFEMEIYFIGEKSHHTKDYLIYYFPSEKLLFEDDLVWIAKEGEIKKAGSRQLGLYNAVKELGLDVETIVQSWPVADYGVKTVIPFEDLEKSMRVK